MARRVFALGLLAAVLCGFWWLAVAPVIAAYQGNAKALAEARAVFARYQSVAAYETRLDDLTKQINAAPAKNQILPGGSDAIALAGLQSALQTIAGSNGAQILSAQALPPLDSGEFLMVGVRVDMVGDLAAIQRTLHKIESSVPFLFVVRANLRRREGAPESAAYEPIVLDTQLDIYGARTANSAGAAP